MPAWLLAADPVAARWREHLRANPVPRGQQVLFLRHMLAADGGEATTPAHAALILDLKRRYLEMHLASPWTAWPCVTIVAGCSRGHHRPGTGVRMAWRAGRSPLPSTPSRPHLKSIYCKLAAHRGEAVRRARQLGLI